MDITNEQWDLVFGLIKKNIPAKKISRRPRVDDREILNGILWICRTGAPWKDLPDRYPPYQTCHRRFQEWVKCLLWEQILSRLAVDLKTRGKIDLAECYIDGSFSAAKKGASELGKLSGARVRSSWQLQTVMVFLSPFPHVKQVPTRLNSLKKRYQTDLREQNLNAWSEIWLMIVILSIKFSKGTALKWSLHIKLTGWKGPHRMDVNYDDTKTGGRLKESLPGFSSFVVVKQDLITMMPIFSDLYN